MRWLLFLSIFLILVFISNGITGSYRESAHGNSDYGVNRSSMSGYSKGNCAHCHEMHASIEGNEPDPASGSPSPWALFADNFNTDATHPYSQSDNFCFYCHCGDNATNYQNPVFYNYNYSRTFGNYTPSPVKSIFEAFNQESYHNLDDIWFFANSTFSFFTPDSNPCVACHNPHIAKRNKANPDKPDYSAISKPSTHNKLFTETMYDYVPNQYQAPYRYTTNCEPDGASCDLNTQAKKTINYVEFCQDCHSKDMSRYGLSHTPINWNTDKHGEAQRSRDYRSGQPIVKPPYDVTAVSNYVLSCLDCHEPHGSYSYKYLIRKEVNGDVTNVTDNSSTSWKTLCLRCHNKDHSGKPCIQCHHHGSSNF